LAEDLNKWELERAKTTKLRSTSPNRMANELLSGKNEVDTLTMSSIRKVSGNLFTAASSSYHGHDELLSGRRDFLYRAHRQALPRFPYLPWVDVVVARNLDPLSFQKSDPGPGRSSRSPDLDLRMKRIVSRQPTFQIDKLHLVKGIH